MKRQAKRNYDTFSVQSNIYNEKAGAQKNIEVGAKLSPINVDGTTYTTSAATAINVGFGTQLAIYNNSSTLAGVRVGQDATVVVSTPGSVDVTTHQATIPLKPNDWTYICTGEFDWVITSAATCLVFVLEDDSSLVSDGVKEW